MEHKTNFNFIKFRTKVWIKRVKFLRSSCTSLLLRSKESSTGKLAAFFQKLKKTVPSLRVNEIKVTSRNTFIDNIFPLESKKESKDDKRSLFRD